MRRIPTHAVLIGLSLLGAGFALPAQSLEPDRTPSTANAPHSAPSIALVTALEGLAMRGKTPLQAFEKLTKGEAINLSQAKLRLVYLDSGRQEIWSGSGRISIGDGESQGSHLPPPQVSQLPELLIKQLAKPTTLAAHERAGAVRLRAMANAQAIEAVNHDYRRLREQVEADDLSPELYRLSALAELKAWPELAQALADTEQRYPQRPEIQRLKALYGLAPLPFAPSDK